jgi:hypothetical protein
MLLISNSPEGSHCQVGLGQGRAIPVGGAVPRLAVAAGH